MTNQIQIKNTERPVAVIVTAISDEIDAVLKHLAHVDEFVYRSFVFDCGQFNDGRFTWKIAVAECGAGNIQAALMVDNAIACFDPDVVIFVGVAGGLKDVSVGDVVASTKIYGFHSGKSSDHFQARPQLEWADLSLEQRAKAVRRRGNWIRRIQCSSPVTEGPVAYVGPIAAGENVVASADSEVFLFLREYYSDALAVEMEGYGFLSAARSYGRPALVIRGISDVCEGKSPTDDVIWQPRSAAHAAAFAFEVLATYSPPPRLALSSSVEPPDSPGDVTPVDVDHFQAALARLSSAMSIQEVPESSWIPRPELQQLRTWFDEDLGRVVCLLGSPGSGKTAILAKIARNAQAEGYLVLKIKADLIPPDEVFTSWAHDRLALNVEVVDAIKQVSQEDKVVIFVDQLDALASTVDLTSERLNNLIEFIHHCHKLPRVSVICSCREFEYQYDTRFAELNTDTVKLELPPWERVADELQKRGVEEAATWPESFREILRVPQHLTIYMKLFQEMGSSEVFPSYQQMLDELWTRRLGNPNLLDFIYSLTEYLIDKESLWAPIVRFEGQMSLIRNLEAVGFLQRQGNQIGFMHQTLLEHAKARLFTKSGQSFCNFVLARQDAILVRPTVWAVLQYLRSADRDSYEQELASLWQSDLRLHLRYLLIDFLGTVPAPESFEILQMADRLAVDEDRKRVLIAIRGKANWFHAFKNSCFPTAMNWGVQDQWPLIGVFGEAWEFAREDCLRLIQTYWLNDPEKDELTWRTMQEIPQWDEETVDMICRIIQRASGDGDRLWWAEHLVNTIAATRPDLASLVFHTTVSRGLNESTEFTTVRSTHRSPLDSSQGWYDLPAVAEAAPVEFLKETWSWFVTVVERCHGGCASSVLYFYEGNLDSLDSERERFEKPVTAAMELAVQETAKSDPDAFLNVVFPSRSVDRMPVHVLICRGFRSAASELAPKALEYLIEDRRRLAIGPSYSDRYRETVALIEAIAPYLDRKQIITLESAIKSWSQYREDVEPCNDQVISHREARLRLFKAIPTELQSPATATLVQSEEAELPDWNRSHSYSRFGFVRELPSLTKEEMVTASDEEILETLRGPEEGDHSAQKWIEEEKGWEMPGGARAATQELAKLAKENPHRVLKLLPILLSEGNESSTASVFHSLADSQLTDVEVFDLMRKLADYNPSSEAFRSDAAYLLYKRSKPKTGLPDDICDLLECWLGMPWDSSYGVFTGVEGGEADSDSNVDSQPVSILWGTRGIGIVDTDRSFWPLLAMTYGLLMNQPPQADRWLKFLEAHLERDISDRTWAAYCPELRWIGIKECDRQRGCDVILKLFDKHPSLKQKTEGIRLVGMAADLIGESFLTSFLTDLKEIDSAFSYQAYGELLVWIALGQDEQAWASDLLMRTCAEISNNKLSEPIAVGMAFAAAELWDKPETRVQASSLMQVLIPVATEKLSQAIGTVFWTADNFPADEHTRNLLRLVADHPSVISGRFVEYLVERLANLLPHCRDEVLAVSQSLVDYRGSEIASLANELYSSGPHLVNIAMTLQRFSNTRSGGLNLLEGLLRLGIGDAFTILNDIDIRPASSKRSQPRTRLRRRKS